jgi:hypothetical protein
MATNTLSENITQAISDFDSIKTALIAKGADVPTGTATSTYGALIANLPSGGGEEIEALCTYDTKTAVEGDKVLINKNIVQTGQCFQTLPAGTYSDDLPFVSRDGTRAVCPKGICMQNSAHQWPLVSTALQTSYAVKEEAPIFSGGDNPYGGIFVYSNSGNNSVADKLYYYKRNDELGYSDRSVFSELNNKNASINQVCALISGDSYDYLYVGEYGSTTNQLFRLAYSDGTITKAAEVTFTLNSSSDLYYPCIVKGNYIITTYSPWKLYQLDTTTNTATYVKSLGSYGEYPAISPDRNTVLTSYGVVDITDPENPVYTASSWGASFSNSYAPRIRTTSTGIDGVSLAMYSMEYGDQGFYAVLFSSGSASLLTNTFYAPYFTSTGEVYAFWRNNVASNQYIGFYKLAVDLSARTVTRDEDYSSPKIGSDNVPLRQFYIDNEGVLYDIVTYDIWQYTAGQGLVQTGTLPYSSTGWDSVGTIHGTPAVSRYNKLTRLKPYPDDNYWTATNISTSSGYTMAFNDAGYVVSNYSGYSGKFAEDGTYTAYSGSNGYISDNCSVALSTSNYAYSTPYTTWNTPVLYLLTFDDSTSTMTSVNCTIPFESYGQKLLITPDNRYLLFMDSSTAVIKVLEIDTDTLKPKQDILYPSALQPVTNKQVNYFRFTPDGHLMINFSDGTMRTFEYTNGMDIMDIQEVDMGLPLPSDMGHLSYLFSPNMRYCAACKDSYYAFFIDRQSEASTYVYKAERYRGNNFSSETVTGIVSEAPTTVGTDKVLKCTVTTAPVVTSSGFTGVTELLNRVTALESKVQALENSSGS